MAQYSNGGQKTGLKKACLWSKMSSIWMVRQVTWLYHLNTGHQYCPVFRWIWHSDGSCTSLQHWVCVLPDQQNLDSEFFQFSPANARDESRRKLRSVTSPCRFLKRKIQTGDAPFGRVDCYQTSCREKIKIKKMKGFEKPGAYFYSNAYKWAKLKKCMLVPENRGGGGA